MNAIRIRINTEDPTNQIFVEIENDDGQSINIGEFIEEDDDGLSTIRITYADLKAVSFSS